MLGIVEILLTVVAWRRGWRGRALWPMGVALVVGLVLGAGAAGSGGNVTEVMPLAVLLDLTCVGVLVRLAARGPQQERAIAAEPPVEELDEIAVPVTESSQAARA